MPQHRAAEDTYHAHDIDEDLCSATVSPNGIQSRKSTLPKHDWGLTTDSKHRISEWSLPPGVKSRVADGLPGNQLQPARFATSSPAESAEASPPVIPSYLFVKANHLPSIQSTLEKRHDQEVQLECRWPRLQERKVLWVPGTLLER